MSYPKTNKRDYPGLETIDTWTSPEVLGMSEDVRLDYENKKKAIDLYRNGNPLKDIKVATGISRQNLHYLLKRCTTPNENGNSIGYAALIKGKQIGVDRSNNIDKLNAGVATSGSLQALFVKYPALETVMKDVILKGLLPNSKRANQRLTWHLIHEVFLNRCNLLEIRPPYYPFCSDSNGKFSLIRWGKRLREKSNADQVASSILENNYFQDFKAPPSRCFERVEVDGHFLDVNWIIEVPGLNGEGIIRMKISRLWLISLLEVKSTAVIGYSIALGRNYNASDVTRAVQSSLVPWKPRDLTVSTIAYKPEECLPNALIPELAYMCYDELWLDNAKSHLSNIFFTMLERTINAVPVFGPKASPNVRPRIELLFDLLEEAGIHCLDGTTGSNPADKRKSTKEEDRFLLGLDTLLDLIDLLIVRYNTGISPGTTISRNEVLKRAVTRQTDIFRHIPENKRATCMKYSIFDEAIIGKERDRPILRWKNARYDGAGLHLIPGLIGEKVLVMAEEDIRFIEAVLLRDGTSLGVLQVEKRWRGTPHSINTRTIIRRYMTNNSFISQAADIPLAFRKHIEREVQENSKKQRLLAQLQKEQDKENQKLAKLLDMEENAVSEVMEKQVEDAPNEASQSNTNAVDRKVNVLDEFIKSLGTAYR